MSRPVILMTLRWLVCCSLCITSLVLAQDRSPAGPPARVEVFVFENGTPVDGLTVHLGDQVSRTIDGSVWFDEAPPGKTRLELFDHAQPLAAVPLELHPAELVRMIITLQGDERKALVSIQSSLLDGAQPAQTAREAGPEAVGRGRLRIEVLSGEDQTPLSGARVYISGTPLDLVTDDKGGVDVELATGSYSVSVLHPDHATRTIDGVEVIADRETVRRIELPPAGLELAEFVVVAPFIEGSLSSVVAQRRDSSAVTDVLSAEQISRAGDSDAGSALKRVTGLTLVDGSFIFVRGLGERYSSVLLNGAFLPSPDPTRRVLPMDLFPTDIISQIVVQKTSDASMPGEFGGGSVQLKTVSYPDDLLFRISLSSGFNSESTGKTGLDAPGGDRDWTGFDDGTRDIPPLLAERISDGRFLRPANLFNPEGVSPEELEAIGEQVAAQSSYVISERSLPADRGLGVSVGNSVGIGPSARIGFLAALRYSDQWRQRNEQRDTFRFSNTGLQPNDSLSVQRTLRNIDLSVFLNTGVEFGDWTRLGVNAMLLRQTESENRISEGQQDSQELRRFLIEWTENELFSIQTYGEHTLPWSGTKLNWQYTTATANRDDPNVREWRRDDDNQDGEYEFSRRADSNSQSWSTLADDLTNLSVDLIQPLPSIGPVALTLKGGLNHVERSRDASIRTFSFIGTIPRDAALLPQEEILSPVYISPSGLRLREGTTPTDNYIAEQQLDAYYGLAELSLWERLILTGGLRVEDNYQRVETNDLTNPDAPPTVGLIDASDQLLSGALTWKLTERTQFRAAYSETLSRPDFREISPSPFIDPVIDLRTVGNPNLKVASIANYDLRLEHYFNEIDSVSFAYFYKDLTNPVERISSSGGSGTIITLQNALGAEVSGWEIDLYRHLSFINEFGFLDRLRLGWLRRIGLENFYIAANYAQIDTEVRIDPNASNSTNANRPLQGASPWVINGQIGYNSPDDHFEITLLYNSFGKRISRAGTLGQPDIYEQPFDQLDLVMKYRAGEHWSFKLELENLLDSTVRFTQGDETTRRYKPGMKIGAGIEYRR